MKTSKKISNVLLRYCIAPCFVAFVAFSTFLLDATTKTASEVAVPHGALEVRGMDCFVNIVNVQNHGVMFGFFSSLFHNQTPFIILQLLITFVLFAWSISMHDIASRVGIGLIVGGAIGNTYDRVVRGYVLDFIDIYVDQYHYPAFNLADVAIVLGVILVYSHFSISTAK
ncbi:Lipoprotein signal peptidase [Candidatus Fokinia solitaria]|uniref:Lipoprotein signal peptidase n=1 Tax=Candidatus Fokinia solitaria TaxID=1802984 RepID=A0A2U8BRS3_9RICK|nr:signal peptidase II [Candidatus Fokinia solitaria]AWD33045.1 Lipoprotein signal peptidase [Candidatus Fokinia solitaria]